MKPKLQDNRTKPTNSKAGKVATPTTPLYNPARVAAEHPPMPTPTPQFESPPASVSTPPSLRESAFKASSQQPPVRGAPFGGPAAMPPPGHVPSVTRPTGPMIPMSGGNPGRQPPSEPNFKSAVEMFGKEPWERAGYTGPGPAPTRGFLGEKGSYTETDLDAGTLAALSGAGGNISPWVLNTSNKKQERDAYEAWRQEQAYRDSVTPPMDDVTDAELLDGQYGIPKEAIEAQIAANNALLTNEQKMAKAQNLALSGNMGLQGGDSIYDLGNIDANYGLQKAKMAQDLVVDNYKTGIQERLSELQMATQKALQENNIEQADKWQQKSYDLQVQQMILEQAYKGPEHLAVFLKEFGMDGNSYQLMMQAIQEASKSGDPMAILDVMEGLSVSGQGDNATLYWNPDGGGEPSDGSTGQAPSGPSLKLQDGVRPEDAQKAEAMKGSWGGRTLTGLDPSGKQELVSAALTLYQMAESATASQIMAYLGIEPTPENIAAWNEATSGIGPLQI